MVGSARDSAGGLPVADQLLGPATGMNGRIDRLGAGLGFVYYRRSRAAPQMLAASSRPRKQVGVLGRSVVFQVTQQ